MAKTKPIITHVEILCHAIRNIENEIKYQESQLGAIPEFDATLKAYVNERTAKLEALKEMYCFETGTKYI
jgi:hypothetical protein